MHPENLKHTSLFNSQVLNSGALAYGRTSHSASDCETTFGCTNEQPNRHMSRSCDQHSWHTDPSAVTHTHAPKHVCDSTPCAIHSWFSLMDWFERCNVNSQTGISCPLVWPVMQSPAGQNTYYKGNLNMNPLLYNPFETDATRQPSNSNLQQVYGRAHCDARVYTQIHVERCNRPRLYNWRTRGAPEV